MILRLLVGLVAAGAVLVSQGSTQTELELAMNELAVVRAREGRTLEPIPLDPRRPEIGVAFMPIHRKLLRARAQVEAGNVPELPVESGRRPGELGVTIIAYPVRCANGLMQPREMVYHSRVGPGRRGPARVQTDGLSSSEIAALFPGFEVPQGVLATAYGNRVFVPEDAVIVRYDGTPCAGMRSEMRYPFEVRLPRHIYDVHAPDSSEDAVVRLRGFVDEDGVVHTPSVVEGDPSLHDEAQRLARQWRFAPGTVNSVIVPRTGGLRIRFGSGR